MKLCINGGTTQPYSLEEDCRAAAAAGFEAVEIWMRKLMAFLEDHSPEDARELFESHGLKPAAFCTAKIPPGLLPVFEDPEEAVAAIGHTADLGRRVGCETLLINFDRPPEDMPYAEAVAQSARVARDMAMACADQGVRLSLETKPNNFFVPTPMRGMPIVEAVDHDAFGLMMDTFHYYRGGVTLADIEGLPVEKIFIVHVADAPEGDIEEIDDFDRVYPGLGVIPIRDMLAVLKRKGYDGFASVELFQEEYWKRPVDVICNEAFEHLNAVMPD